MKSPVPKERLRVSNWIVRRLLSDCEGRSSVSRQLVYSPPGSLLSTRSTHGRLKMAARKLKTAIYKCVLAHGHCNAVTMTTFRWRADSVLPQFFQARVAHASTVASRCQRHFLPSAKIRCISAARLRETAARRRPRRFAMPNPQSRMAGRKRSQAVAQGHVGIPQVDSLAGTRNSPMLCASPSSWHRSRTSAGSSTPSSPSQGRKPCSHIRHRQGER